MPDTPLPLIDDSAAPPTPAAAPADVPVQAAAESPAVVPAELPPLTPAAELPPLAEPLILPVMADVVTLPAPAQPAPPAVPVDAATPATAPSVPELSPIECAARLAELFPALFAAVPNTPPRPIKLRIQTDIQQRAPGLFSRRSLSPFLHRHTTTTAYLRALVAATHRYDLDGAPAGEVSDEHRQAAQAELDRRRAIVESRRAAERQARQPRARDAAPREQAPATGPARPAGPEPREGGDARRRPPRRPPAPLARRSDEAPASERQPLPPRPKAHARVPAQTWPRTPLPVQPPLAEPAPPPEDPARRERAQLLRAFESSPLSRANFCALKRIEPAALDAMLEQARREAPPAAAPTRPQPAPSRHTPRRPPR